MQQTPCVIACGHKQLADPFIPIRGIIYCQTIGSAPQRQHRPGPGGVQARRISAIISSICARVMTSGGAMIMRSPTARMIRPLRKQWPRQIMPTSRSGRRAARGLVLHQHQPGDQAAGLGVAHQRVLGLEFGKALGQVGADVVLHPVDQALALHQVQVGQRHRAGHRVAAVGVAVVELAALARSAPRPRGRPPSRRPAGCSRWSRPWRRSSGRADAELLVGEPVAQCGRRRRSPRRLISRMPYLSHDALDLGPVGAGRDDHAAGALHRLADEGRHLVGADSRIFSSSQRAARRPNSSGFRRRGPFYQ
jgi:hypothetical protein